MKMEMEGEIWEIIWTGRFQEEVDDFKEKFEIPRRNCRLAGWGFQ